MNQQQNRSTAKSQKLVLGSGDSLSYLNFLSNINSRESTMDSNNLQVDFTTIEQNPNSKLIILGIKTPKTVAIVLLHSDVSNRAELKHQMNFEEKWIDKNNITAFKFTNAIVSDYLDLQVILGSSAGGIRIYKVRDSQLSFELNMKYEKERDIWFKKRVLKIALHPTEKQTMVALFEGGYLLEYNLNDRNEPPSTILDSIQKINELFAFQLEKQQTQTMTSKQKQYDNFTWSFYNNAESTFMSIVLKSNDYNLKALYRFECTTINEIEILKFSPLQDQNIDYKMDYIVVAMTGLDGHFRILELKQMIHIFSFRSDFGGFNSFSFNSNYSMVLLAGQDDHAYLISFDQNISWFKLKGHNSFIGRAVFQNLNDDYFRVIIGSYDGNLSFTEFQKKFISQDIKGLRISGLEDSNTQTHEIQNKILMNRDGICYVQEYFNYLATVNFDGCITIFLLQDYTQQGHRIEEL